MNHPEIITDPQSIANKSLKMIDELLGERPFPLYEREIVKRVVHAAGDLSLADMICWSENAAEEAVRAIREGCSIITDVKMVMVGINSKKLSQWGGTVKCFVDEKIVERMSSYLHQTRAMLAMRLFSGWIDGNIVAIGNSPTAMYEVLCLIKKGVVPRFIIGVPVGFVGAAEVKDMVKEAGVPFITLTGTRGGSNIAAAIVNALLYIADNG